MPAAKGQASLVDILLLGLAISVMLAMSTYVGEEQLKSQMTREESMYAHSMLVALMNYRGETYGSYNNIGNITVAEALDAYFCGNGISEEDINRTVTGLLNRTVKPGYNYIFYALAGSKMVHAYNSQPDICASYIPIASLEIGTSCGTTVYQQPMLGIWPEWKKLPRKNEPPCAEEG